MSLFEIGETTKKSRKQTRAEKAKLCYQLTSEAWKDAVYRFAVREYLPSHSVFIFEDLSTAYETAAKRIGWPATVERRAFAGLRNRLVAEGLMVSVAGEFRQRNQGNASQVYRSLMVNG